MKTWDTIVIGGGIIGLSLSIALKKRGARVLLIERGEPGREASHAAGGMLVDWPLETPSVLQPLAAASARMYPEFAHELEVESGIKVDLRDFGTICIASDDENGHSPQTAGALDRSALADLEPALIAPKHSFYLKERSVDPRGLTAAALQTAKRRGVDFSSGDPVLAVNICDHQIIGATTARTSFLAPQVVNCAGAWSGQIAPRPFPTRPVKGQMLCLAMPSRGLIKHVIRSPKAYLIPRSDGRLLVGATVEEAGFDKRTDAATMQRFHRAAIQLVPQLEDARILGDWAGLRPGTPDALPILGATETPGYFVATGHFRDGILLAPITAEVMTAVLEGRESGYDLSSFSPVRF